MFSHSLSLFVKLHTGHSRIASLFTGSTTQTLILSGSSIFSPIEHQDSQNRFDWAHFFPPVLNATDSLRSVALEFHFQYNLTSHFSSFRYSGYLSRADVHASTLYALLTNLSVLLNDSERSVHGDGFAYRHRMGEDLHCVDRGRLTTRNIKCLKHRPRRRCLMMN